MTSILAKIGITGVDSNLATLIRTGVVLVMAWMIVFIQGKHKNVITANGTVPLEFAKEILFALNVADEKTIADWYNFHKLGVYTASMPKM